jgi:aminoglycoside phosphotransferase
MLASALRAFHSVNATDCPFEAYVPGESIVRADACLPNIVAGEDGSNGYVDLADMRAGPRSRGRGTRQGTGEFTDSG